MKLQIPSRALLLVLVGLVGCERRAAEPWFVGHLATLSGPQRERGLAAVQGIQLAVDEVNADTERWVGGRKVAVIHADTVGLGETSERQAVRLAAINRVSALLGGMTRVESVALGKVAREFGLPLLGVAGTDGPGAGFALGLSPEARARAFDAHLASHGSPDQIVVVADATDPGLHRAADRLAELCQARGRKASRISFGAAQEVEQASLPPGDSPVVVFAAADVALGLHVSGSRLYYAGDETAADRLPVGTRYVAAYGPVETPARTAFANKYRERFGAEPPDDAVRMYDAARVVFRAAAGGRSFVPTKFVPAIKSTKFDLTPGPVEFAADRVARMTAFVFERTEAGPVLRGRYEPAVEPAASPMKTE